MPDEGEAAGAPLRDRPAPDEFLFRSLVDGSLDVLWAVDLAGDLVYCSPSIEGLRGYTAEEMIGQNLREMLTPDGYVLAAARLQALRDGTEPLGRQKFEFEMYCKDGSTVWADVQAEPLFRDGRLIGVIGVTRDASAGHENQRRLREANRELQHAAQVKDRFLATMSHEIRTPMNGVLGMIELLLDSGPSEEQRRHLETARAAGWTLTTLLDDLIAFSNLSTGTLTLENAPIDLPALVDSVVAVTAPEAAGKGLRLDAHVDAGLPRHVVGDGVRLRQLLLNLVGNAVKFTEDGSVRITAAPLGGMRIRFAVTDTGPGIPEERRQHLFEDFYQVDASITRRHGGAGLGLAIARRLVAAMDGRIGCNSVEGRGSTFWFEVDLPEAAPLPELRSEQTRPLSLLVAEDIENNAKVIRAVLEREGHRVVIVGNGRQAVEAAAAGSFDAILMDVFMPEMDGIEATRRIRALPSPAGTVPILALTANILPQARDDYVSAGMDQVLLKPIDVPVLRRALIAVADGTARPEPAMDAAPHGGAVLDRTWLEEMLLALPPGQLTELIGKAGIAMAEHLGEMEVRLAAGDLAPLAVAAHRLAGLAAMYGCVRLRAVAVAMEDAARAGRVAEIDGGLAGLAEAVDEALRALEEVLKGG